MNPTQQPPHAAGPSDADIEASLGRLAQAMPTDNAGLAGAALREATTIRRRRRGLAAAGLATALAIAAPVAWQVGHAPGRAPVGPAQVHTGTPSNQPVPSGSATSLPTTHPSTQATTPRPAQRAVTLPVTGTPTGTLIRPYAVAGTYHGASGTAPLAADYGVVGVLNLKNARVVSVNALGQGQWTTVQDLSGTVLATLQGVDGRPVANAAGDRFALVDNQGGRVLLFDDKGRQLASVADAKAAAAVGFAGRTVLYSRGSGTFAWDTATGAVTTFDRGTAVDASDRLGLVLVLDSTTDARSCWSVRTTKAAPPSTASRQCTPGRPRLLSADGAHVIASRPAGPDGPNRAFVYPTGSSSPALTVAAPTGAEIWGMSWRPDLASLVLNVVTADGADRLVGCGLDGRCAVLTATVANPGWPEKETPYVLVRD